MKLTYREIEPFVKSPNKTARVIIVYGPDGGLVSERAATMGKTIVADLNDPFNVCALTAEQLVDDPARLSDEANAISMMGGDRLIRIDGGADKITTILKEYLVNPSMSALVIVQAGELSTKSSLRKLGETAKNAVSIPCYVEDERDLSRFIGDTLRSAGKSIDRDASVWLAANISGDRAKVRSELEKLITYKGDENSPISIKDVRAACGMAGAQGFDDLVYAVGGGNAAGAMKAYATLIDEGENFITILRVLQGHFRKLHQAQAFVAYGIGAGEAMKKLSPPIFFKQEAAFQAQMSRWSRPVIEQVLSRLIDLEAQCKQTGMPAETLCAQAILSVSKARTA